jgi:hypothetical protein
MVRPLKYGEKTSVRSVTIPDSMWEALPEPRSQWVVEAIRQMQENPRAEGGPVPEWKESPRPVELMDPALKEDLRAEIAATPIEEFLASVPEPIRSEVPKQDCPHPKARQVNVIGGKKCLDCGKVKGIQGTWT